MHTFQANCLPVLIGSLPIDDHQKAAGLVLKYCPQIPLWAQLPVYPEEQMIAQFLPGLPGIITRNNKTFIDTSGNQFDDDILKFYEEYFAVTEGITDLDGSRFALGNENARGFFVFVDRIKQLPAAPLAVKGQITGPITFCTSINDQDGKAIFYHDQTRDAAVKLIALKAKWQTQKLLQFKCPVIIFFDEPALTGFGSSAFIGITHEEIAVCLEEVITAVHDSGGITGIHVCANADWSLILESSADIVSFDAYSFFDRFLLYPDQIIKFIDSGRILAWGIVPTLKATDIEKETADSLVENWQSKVSKLEKLGVDRKKIIAQSLISPSCGTGSLSLDHAIKVLTLTNEVSDKIRKEI